VQDTWPAKTESGGRDETQIRLCVCHDDDTDWVMEMVDDERRAVSDDDDGDSANFGGFRHVNAYSFVLTTLLDSPVPLSSTSGQHHVCTTAAGTGVYSPYSSSVGNNGKTCSHSGRRPLLC
jgi:hypothetical protein